MRYLILVATSLFLCQCNTTQRNIAPVVSPSTGEPVVFALKNVNKARPSQMMAAMENLNDKIRQDAKTKDGALKTLGALDPKTQKAGYALGGPTIPLKAVNGSEITVLLPMINVMTDGVPPEKVSAAMPAIQAYCYKLLCLEFRPVAKSELKLKPKAP